MDAHSGQPHYQTGSVRALYDKLSGLVAELPNDRQTLLVNELEEIMTMADELRQAINDSGITHYRLAQETGVTAGVISRFMAGERDLRLETASKLADALGLELKLKKGRRKKESPDSRRE